MAKASIARRVAFEVLLRVVGGGYASELLIERTAGLESRDAGLAAEITLGVLRRKGQLNALIERLSGRSVKRLDVEVAIALRMAIYQLRFLDRVPPYAAVNDSLQLLRGARKTSAVAFANAVLRKASVSHDAVEEKDAAPAWLLEKWTNDFGVEVANGIAGASLLVPLLYQHVPPGGEAPVGGHPTDVPGCWQVDRPDPRYRVQDIGSQAIVPLLELTPESRFLDVCAAPGNKTSQALELTLRTVSSDLSFHRLKGLRTLGVPLVALDAAWPFPFSAAAKFDRILVDAPCSGTGTLGHNPEIKWRLQPAEFLRFAGRQKLILENALAVLARGGLLVYSTCSLEPEENEAVVRAVAPTRIVREIRRIPGRDPGDGFYAAVIR